VAKLSKKNEELLKAVQKQTTREQGLDSRQASQSRQEPANVEATGGGESPKVTSFSGDISTASSSGDPSIASSSGDHSTVSVGVDLVEIERMEQAIRRTPRILERVFTSAEREYAGNKTRPAMHYATFFAAREAVLKALGCGFAGINYQDVEIAHDENGRPSVFLHGSAAALAERQHITEIQISLSHTHQMAVASAVALRAQSSPRKNEVLSPMEELARQFKELRSLLDDLGVSAIIDQQDEQEEDPDEGQEEDQAQADPATGQQVEQEEDPEKADPAGEDKREGTDE